MIGVEQEITEQKANYEVLKEREERYRAIFENSIDGILIINPDGSIYAANPAACRILGRTEEDIIRSGSSGIVDTKEPGLNLVLEEISRSGKARGELKFVRGDGDSFPAEFASSLYGDKEGNISTLVIFRDISNRKRAEEQLIASENKFSAAFQISPDPLAITDIFSGKIIDVNKSFEEATGFTRDELLGRSTKDLNIWANLSVRESVIHLLLNQNEVRDYPVRMRIKNGDIRDMLFSARIIKIANNSYLLTQAHDITENKRLEESLKRRSEELEVLVEERTEQLRKAERLATIGETSAMIGHDLRNPLQALYCMIYLARQQIDSRNLGSQEAQMRLDDILDNIEESADYMNKIISDVQDYARTLSLDLLPTDISFFIRDTLSTIKIPDKVHVAVSVDEDIRELNMDQEKMKRVIINLVTNSINAMPEEGNIEIDARRSDDFAVISIEDTGTGIPEEMLPKLFLPLFTTRSKGVGLGLSVCKRMVDAMGGDISIKSKLGEGTQAIVKIPMR